MASGHILSKMYKGVRTIQFNRPKMLNAINSEMYREVARILNEDSNNDEVVATILTGAGDIYSSGNDFSLSKGKGNPQTALEELIASVQGFMVALINYPKLLIAVVNGPAFGVATTTLGLCDIVYASDRAIFNTPFMKLGVTPEGCSSYTFPRLLGRSKATEILLLGETMTAQEALQRGFIAKIIPHENINKFIAELHKFGQLPVNTVKNGKELIMAPLKNKLMEINKSELDKVSVMFKSPEFSAAMSTFLRKSSKL